LGKPANSVVKTNGLQITTIEKAQLLALNATPITIVTAPGAGKIAVLDLLIIHKPANNYTNVGATEDLIARYTDASGAQVSAAIETTGFLDNAAAQTAYARGVGTFGTIGSTTAAALGLGGVLSVANAAIVLHLTTAEILDGDGDGADLTVHAYYDVYDHVLASA
jgi:hypothetical protein